MIEQEQNPLQETIEVTVVGGSFVYTIMVFNKFLNFEEVKLAITQEDSSN